ncbi:MAG TPA: class I SAM-dependent methyltransferase [Candidatus Dormibacteraeota bacterium]|nr:class I SAM-dependent methyltransferase [Candidatus Dormibacteraeota bacterium]
MSRAPADADVDYDPRVYADLFAVEDRHFWFRARNRAIVTVFDSIREHLAPGYRVLEVGCGTGNVLRALHAAAIGGNVVGMDVHLEGLRYARRRAGFLKLVGGDLWHPPFSVGFDVVGVFDVLEHIDDDVAALRALGRVLRAGGTLFLTVPADPKLWSYFDLASHHKRRYVEDELRSKLVEAGFSVEYLTPYMSVLRPFMSLGRRAAVLRHADPHTAEAAWEVAAADLRVRPVTGTMFELLLRYELGFLRRYRRVPSGTSLLAVARSA